MNFQRSLDEALNIILMEELRDTDIYNIYAIAASGVDLTYFKSYIDVLARHIYDRLLDAVKRRLTALYVRNSNFSHTQCFPSRQFFIDHGGSGRTWDILYGAVQPLTPLSKKFPTNRSLADGGYDHKIIYGTRPQILKRIFGDPDGYYPPPLVSNIDLMEVLDLQAMADSFKFLNSGAFSIINLARGGIWEMLFNQLNHWGSTISTGTTSNKIVAIDTILSMAHHHGPIIDHLVDAGSTTQIIRAMNAKFNADTVDMIWNNVSEAIARKINHLRRSQGLPLYHYSQSAKPIHGNNPHVSYYGFCTTCHRSTKHTIESATIVKCQICKQSSSRSTDEVAAAVKRYNP